MRRRSQPTAPFPGLGQDLDLVGSHPLPGENLGKLVDDKTPIQVFQGILHQSTLQIIERRRNLPGG